METTPLHLSFFEKSRESFSTIDGINIETWTLQYVEDDKILRDWARHFRQHYCNDTDMMDLVAGTGKTNAEFLTEIKFPHAKDPPGPSTRSGDFGEILVADYIEYILGYWCPRQVRYEDRFNRNVSTNGCDILAFKFADLESGSTNDELFLLESKAAFTSTNKNRLQEAIDGSIKDAIREAMSLSAIKQRLLRINKAQALRIQRFQNSGDHPFQRKYGAAVVLEEEVFKNMNVAMADSSLHPNRQNLKLIVIRGTSMMNLVHALYQRAADEA